MEDRSASAWNDLESPVEQPSSELELIAPLLKGAGIVLTLYGAATTQ